MKAPSVSVIIPCYCAAVTLPETVRSVLAQGFMDFEIVIVDDGSTDSSVTVAHKLAEGEPRIRVITQSNAGPAAARNRGIAAARGDVIAFIDADDSWARDHLTRHIGQFTRYPSCGVSFARIQFFDPTLTIGGAISAHIPVLTLGGILGENPICTTSNLVARASIFADIGGFDPGLTHGEDQEWVARVLAKTPWQVFGLNKILVRYRTSHGGLSADIARTRAGWLAMLARVRGYAPDDVRRAAPAASALFHRYLARRALRTGQSWRSIDPLLRAWRSSPLTLLTCQPHRTAMTTMGVLASLVPFNPLRALLAR